MIPTQIADLLSPIIDDVETMIELGNKRDSEGVWKKLFTEMGIEHTSIDLNGRDGALELDLLGEISLPSADVVTNIGTSEHVSDEHEGQMACFENINRLSHKWMIHQVPLVGNWDTHGIRTDGRECFKYTEDFFYDISDKFNYIIEDLFISGEVKRKLINVRFRHGVNVHFGV